VPNVPPELMARGNAIMQKVCFTGHRRSNIGLAHERYFATWMRHQSSLRKKMNAAGADTLIHTRRGMGYVMEERSAPFSGV